MAVATLFVVGVLLAAGTVLTRRPMAAQAPELDEYLTRWSAAHDGYDAAGTRLLRGWLTVVHRVARPVAAAGVAPDVVTLWTVWVSLAVIAMTLSGGWWRIAAAVVVLVGGLGDALDGAVAVLADRASAWGYVLDSLVDRINDGLYLVAAWIAGAPGWLAVSCGAALGLLEYLRARAGNAGADHTSTITVGERPQRIICCAIAVGLSGIAEVSGASAAPAGSGAAGGPGATFAMQSLLVLLALTVAGLVQLTVAVYRQLRARPQ